MKIAKTIIIGGALIGAAIAGDYTNINDKINQTRYSGTEISGYQQPFDLEKRYQKNEQGQLETYIGQDQTWYKIEENLRVNERSLKEHVTDEGETIYKDAKTKYDQLKEKAMEEYQKWKGKQSNK